MPGPNGQTQVAIANSHNLKGVLAGPRQAPHQQVAIVVCRTDDQVVAANKHKTIVTVAAR